MSTAKAITEDYHHVATWVPAGIDKDKLGPNTPYVDMRLRHLSDVVEIYMCQGIGQELRLTTDSPYHRHQVQHIWNTLCALRLQGYHVWERQFRMARALLRCWDVDSQHSVRIKKIAGESTT